MLFIFFLQSCNQNSSSLSYAFDSMVILKDKYPNFEVGLKCIIMVF